MERSAIFMIVVGLSTLLGECYENPILEFSSYGQDRISKVFVQGDVVCERRYVPGAVIGLECPRTKARKIVKKVVTKQRSDEHGGFVIDVPSWAHPAETIEKCTVRVLHASLHQIDRQDLPSNIALFKASYDVQGVRNYYAGPIDICEWPF